MNRLFQILTITVLFSTSLSAQPFNTDAAKQGLKGSVHWVKRTWYKPKPNDKSAFPEPDKSSLPNVYMRPNQLIEYNKNGKMQSCMDYKSGSDEQSGPTMHYYYEGSLLKKQVQENDAYVAMYTTLFSYDADSHEIKRQTTPGAGDKMGIADNETVENTWQGNNLVKEVSMNAQGKVRKELTYTYNDNGRKIRTDMKPAGLYSGYTYSYDGKGNLINETYLAKDGTPTAVYTYEYDGSNRQTKRKETNYYNGNESGIEITTRSYDANGGITRETILKDGKETGVYEWKSKYDDKQNCIRKLHIKNGKVELIEEREIRYY